MKDAEKNGCDIHTCVFQICYRLSSLKVKNRSYKATKRRPDKPMFPVRVRGEPPITVKEWTNQDTLRTYLNKTISPFAGVLGMIQCIIGNADCIKSFVSVDRKALRCKVKYDSFHESVNRNWLAPADYLTT